MAQVRTKIRSDNVMPAILEMLQRDGVVSKARIEEAMLRVAEREGLGYRTQAVGFALTALKRMGWAYSENGRWGITTAGTKVSLTEEQVGSIGRSLWPPTANGR